MRPGTTLLILDIEDKLLERSLKELFDPLPEFEWGEEGEAHLKLTDRAGASGTNVIVLNELPLDASKLLQDINFKLRGSSIAFGEFVLSPTLKILRTPRGEYPLTEKEISLLMVLLEKPGHSVGKEDLLHRVWNYSAAIDTHTLETHIYRLRQKLEEDPTDPKVLKSGEEGYFVKID